jgi:hypothetical protein
MKQLNTVLSKKGDSEGYHSNSIFFILKEIQNKLNLLETELKDMKLVFNHFTNSKSKSSLNNNEESLNNIEFKIKNNHFNDCHIDGARAFINTMIENDKKEFLKAVEIRAESLFDFMPLLSQKTSYHENDNSSTNFFKQLDSENLLDLLLNKKHKYDLVEEKIIRKIEEKNLDKIRCKKAGNKVKSRKLKVKLSGDLSVRIGEEFIFCDGFKASSINELYLHLLNSDDNLFNYHVNLDRNDFASWINDVFKQVEIANLIRSIKLKQDFLDLLKTNFLIK